MSAGRVSRLFRPARADQRLLVGGPPLLDRRLADLPDLLRPGDLLIVNDSGTMPASLSAHTEDGQAVELRLCGWSGDLRRWPAVAFGAGTWRTPTEHRLAPPPLAVGSTLFLGDQPIVLTELLGHPRLGVWDLGPDPWSSIWRRGKPVQYSYMRENLTVQSVQLPYAARPWSAEMPSAGRPLTHHLRTMLFKRGINVVSLTHAAGLSSTGDDELDAKLPFPEHYHLPESVVQAVQTAGRVIAVGTSVVRALEGNHQRFGKLQAGEYETDLVLERGSPLRVVDGLISGIHLPGESHFRLLEAFVGNGDLDHLAHHALKEGYRSHEFGDSMLVFGG